VAVAGNISPAALDALREAIEARALPQVWVLELASYQLALADSFVPDCATVLNLTQDHLDWHPDMADYLAAKQRIYTAGSLWVFNRDDPLTVPGATLHAPVVVHTPVMTKAAAAAAARAAAAAPVQPRVSFGLDAPRLAGDLGLVHESGLVWLAEAVEDGAFTSPVVVAEIGARFGSAERLADALSQLQGQDVMRQRVEAVQQGLQELQQHLQDMAGLLQGGEHLPALKPLQLRLQEQATRYVMDSQRSTHARITGGRGTGASADAGAEAQRVELF
jgi:UDP-N-acetylmuramoylalanine-D-glutamate ligase